MSVPMPMLPRRSVTELERAAYARDGAVVLRGVLDLAWVERMRAAIDTVLAAPGDAAVEYAEGGAAGRYLGDFLMWMHNDDFREIALASPLPALAAEIMQSREVRLFYDQLLVKEPGTPTQTPWHQDLPYWPLRGADILSLWIGFDRVTAESGAMRYVKGSHLPGVLYAPTPFGKTSGFAAILARAKLPPFPDMGKVLETAELLICEVEPGDVVVHHPLTFHWSPGNLDPVLRRRALALRYVGDDARFDPAAANFLDHPKLAPMLKEPPGFSDGEPLSGANFPVVWPRTTGQTPHGRAGA